MLNHNASLTLTDSDRCDHCGEYIYCDHCGDSGRVALVAGTAPCPSCQSSRERLLPGHPALRGHGRGKCRAALRGGATVRRFQSAEDVAKYERTLGRRGFMPHPNAQTGKTRWQHVDGGVVVVYQEATRSYVAIAWGA